MTKKIPQTQERKVSLAGSVPDVEARTIRAALSSEAPVNRPFGREVLVHSEDAIDTTRANGNGLPLLINHDDGSPPIGRIRSIELDADGVLRGDLYFSDATQASRDAWALVQDGTLSDVSVRYTINKIADRAKDSDEVRVVDWSLVEGSVVSVPADPSVGIGRQMELEGIDMPEHKTEAPAPVSETRKTPSASRAAGRDEGARLERERMTAIDDVADNFRGHSGVADLAREAKSEGWPIEQFKDQVIIEVAGGTPAEPLSRPVRQERGSIVAGEDGREKMTRGFEEALSLKMGVLRGDEEAEARRSEFTGMHTIEIGRRFLEAGGVSCRGLAPAEIAGQMLTRYIDPGTVPASGLVAFFPDLLENIGNKALFQGFEEAPVTYQLWTGSTSAADFKAGTMPGLSSYPDLAVTADGDAIVAGKMEDKKESFQVETYTSKYALSRAAMVNDDLGGFGDTARKMGIAANRTLDNQVYAFVEANGVMTEDATALFDAATHNNLVSAAGGPSTDNVGTARTTMGKQTDWNTGVETILGIVPQYMVCPIELEQAMLEISVLNSDPERVRRDNVYKTLWTPVATPKLTDANDWYMFGQRGEHINVVYLNNQRTPMLARDEGWSVLSAHWRVVFDFDVMAADWRSAIKFTNV